MGWKERLERTFAAAAFAEVGCRDAAREIMGASPQDHCGVDFLSAVGLKGVRVRYGMAQLADSLDFASAVGLGGVRVVYGVAHVSD